LSVPAERARPAGAWGAAAALLFVVLWASAYVPSKIGATLSPPYWFLFVRFVAAAIVLFAITFALRRPMPFSASEWGTFALLGVLANTLYLGLTYTAMSHGMSSGVGAIVASMNPLLLALVAPWILREPLTPLKSAGLLLGFGGVLAIVLARAASGTAAPIDVAFAVAGVCASVASTIIFKRARGANNVLAITAIGFLGAAAATLPFALLLEGPLPTHFFSNPALLGVMAYLVCVLSVGASLLWFWLLTHGEASRVSAYYFLTPAFGLAFGAVLLHEHFHSSDLAGLIAISAGIILVQRSPN
jgi:drug/metabolite transporter (DMT)-like permease